MILSFPPPQKKDKLNNGFDSTFSKDKKIDLVTYIHGLTLYFKKYKIEVIETRMNDSIYFEYSNVFNQIPLQNHVYFYSDNKLISETIIPFKKVSAGNYLKKQIEYLDNKISQINLLKTKDTFLISIAGYGGCNSCNESTIYFSLTGDIIYFWYGNKNKIIKNFKSNKISSVKELEDAKIFNELPF